MNLDILKAYEFKSLTAGKNVLITGAVHGNEICGTVAINNIIEKINSNQLRLKRGSITFIPISNPQAYKNNSRFYEINLNRVVKKHKNPKLYEEKIANILVEYIKNSDYHLDIHSMHQNNTPMVFQDYPESEKMAKMLGFEYILVGWPEIYKNSKTIKDYSTQAYAHRVKSINCTAECGSHNDPNSIKMAEKSILRLLSFLDMIDYTENEKLPKQKFVKMEKVIFKEHIGKFNREYGELGNIKKGEIIATYDNGKTITAEKNYIMIMPNNNAKIGEEWFYLGSI